jgi:membrane protein
MNVLKKFQVWLLEVAHIPWFDALQTLRARFQDDRLSLTASSLTFTTTIALVPLITVALAVFTAFPMFAKFQDVLQKWLIESLVPDNIARQVVGNLNQFAGKASKLGVAGLAVLLGTALALMLTIDHTLNSIWRVRTAKPLGQRVLIYWTAMTLGPLLLGASLSMTTLALTASKGVVGTWPGGVTLLLDFLQFLLVAAGMASMFRYVPNAEVRWGHAWMGGFFVSAGLELAKKALAFYLSQVPTYSVVYGAFATVPILLVWIYVAWVIVLLGAALTAYLPSLITGVSRRRLVHGWQFLLALDVLRHLETARAGSDKGLSLASMCSTFRVDPLRLEPVLQALIELDWVGQLSAHTERGEPARYVMLVNPTEALLEPLMERLLLDRNATSEKLWEIGRWRILTLREVL